MALQWFLAIAGVVFGGGLVGVFTIPQVIKKARAEAKAAEMDNVQKASEAWKELAEERQEAYNELHKEYKDETEKKNAKIDDLYMQINDWRDKYNHSQEDLSQERIWRASNEVKLCQVKGCDTRTPPTGY